MGEEVGLLTGLLDGFPVRLVGDSEGLSVGVIVGLPVGVEVGFDVYWFQHVCSLC